MLEFFQDEAVQIVLSFACLAILAAVAAYVFKKIRALSVQQEPTAHELMAKFRDLHTKGELTDGEFREIKTTLAARLQEELKDNGETG